MAPLSALGVAALALLREGQMHPYEMYGTLVKRREDHLVKVSAGSLYRTVERLAADGLVEAAGTGREGNRPERTTYAITERGIEALHSRLVDLIRTPAEEYPIFPLAVGEAHNLDRDLVLDLFTSHRAQLDGRLAEYDAALDYARSKGVDDVFMIDVDYLRAVTRAQRDWIATLITRITTKELSWPIS